MSLWQVPSPPSIPNWFLETVRSYTPDSDGHYAAQLLWQRGIQDKVTLLGFIDTDAYRPTSPFTFGQEMKWAVQRFKKALQQGEKVTIWGDFDADGITATSVLWDGLGQFFPQYLQLDYYIPNRIKESHGLNIPGIEQLAQNGTRLIVTCDTGSTNLTEIDFANGLGIDLIITDHHTLPDDRPPVISIINPRYFVETHPLYNLSGVAVAYKLVEALYQTLPHLPQQPLENLLDLVAIGLIADLVQLSGDCRYLAKKGIEQLQKQTHNSTRPGIAKLLELCKRSGDRATDISFGLGPRINAVSRIHGDASFCIELLTSKDTKRCHQLAEETELANTRRKGIQQEIIKQVKKKLDWIDLSTTNVIILDDPQWQAGILGLVAGQIAQEYNRPTILLSTAEDENNTLKLAKGSARSIQNIDLYELVSSQSYLLHRFGGHPLAAGLSLPIENLPLFREGINQQLRQKGITFTTTPKLEADLVVTVSELSIILYKELKLLEPCGMGNRKPKLLIQNCWFEQVKNNNAQDFKGKKVSYIKTTFELWDNSVSSGFPGVWWGHYKEELPPNTPCDVLVELDDNMYIKRYEVNLIAVQVHASDSIFYSATTSSNCLIDWRNQELNTEQILRDDLKLLQDCPTAWTDIQNIYRQTMVQKEKLALAYSASQSTAQFIWKQLVGIAKYLSSRNKAIILQQLQDKLEINEYTLQLGLEALSKNGFEYQLEKDKVILSFSVNQPSVDEASIIHFQDAIAEGQFQRQYFAKVPLLTLQAILEQNL